MPARLTQEEFIKKCKSLHGDKYDYSFTEYKTCKIEVKVICKKHGEFWQMPSSHVHGIGCPKCGREITGQKTKYSNDEFIKKCREVHGDKYDYSKVNYVRGNDKVIITCPKHGDFLQRGNGHIAGKGCSKCKFEEKFKGDGEFRRQSYEKWKGEIIPIEEYKGDHEKMLFKHVKCGHIFTSAPYCHLRGSGCPKCRCKSKMENTISNWFKSMSISFEEQKRFDDCRYKYPLPFDFYLNDYKFLIEYDGEHHFSPLHSVQWAKDMFEEIKIRDSIKTKWCQENNIKLIRISYLEKDRYQEILRRELNIK